MDRGGGLLHFSSPRIPASAPLCFLLSSASFSPRCVESSGNLRTSPEPFRSFPWRESFLNLHKALHKSQYAVKILRSCEPQVVDLDGKEIARKNKLLIDCEIDQQRVAGGIVALGKFDALHLGHRELIIQASKDGIPFLLSFVGVAEVLGRESRAPIVAKCDRSRVLSLWGSHCNGIVPLEYQIDFSNVRHLSPRLFIQRLSDDLRAGGIVAGSNYRFGYKASGDANDLVRLCGEYGLFSCIVDSVNAGGAGEISSTRVRNALSARDMALVTELLGRKHRLMLVPPAIGKYRPSKKVLIAPKSCLLNQPPGDGEFKDCTFLLDGVDVGRCFVKIDSKSISIELDCGIPPPIGLIGIEF